MKKALLLLLLFTMSVSTYTQNTIGYTKQQTKNEFNTDYKDIYYLVEEGINEHKIPFLFYKTVKDKSGFAISIVIFFKNDTCTEIRHDVKIKYLPSIVNKFNEDKALIRTSNYQWMNIESNQLFEIEISDNKKHFYIDMYLNF